MWARASMAARTLAYRDVLQSMPEIEDAAVLDELPAGLDDLLAPTVQGKG